MLKKNNALWRKLDRFFGQSTLKIFTAVITAVVAVLGSLAKLPDIDKHLASLLLNAVTFDSSKVAHLKIWFLFVVFFLLIVISSIVLLGILFVKNRYEVRKVPEKLTAILENVMGAVRQIRDQQGIPSGAIKAFDSVHRVYLVDRDLTASVTTTYQIRAIGSPLNFWGREIQATDEADPADSFESIGFRVRNIGGNPANNVVFLPALNEVRKKEACIFFLPPVKPDTADIRKIQISYEWKGFLKRLEKLSEDFNFKTKVKGKMDFYKVEIYLKDDAPRTLECEITGARHPNESLTEEKISCPDGWSGKGYVYTVWDLPAGEIQLTLRAKLKD